MSNAGTSTQLATASRNSDFTEEQIEVLKQTIAKGATDIELALFLATAKRTGLDPMARQIFAVSRWDGQAQKNVMSIQISIDGFRAIADRTGRYVPSKEPTYTFDAQNNLESATAYIKKFVAGAWHEIAATAFYEEYVQTTKDGNPNRMWQKMPRLMLAKTAESLVLRKAFPAELSGLYTNEEMGTTEETGQVENIHPVKPQLVEIPKPAELRPLTEAEENYRSEIIALSEVIGKNPDQTLIYFDDNPAMRENCLRKVQRAAIKHVIASDDWAYEPDGTTEFLAAQGIDGIDAAGGEALDKCVAEMRDLGLL